MSEMKLSLNSLIRRAALILCAAIFFTLTVSGQSKLEMIDDFSIPVKENPNATYSDLINLVFPKTGENRIKSIPLNNIFGDYRGRVFEGNLRIGYARAARVKINGREHLLLLINVDGDENGEMFLWQEMNVLALFDVRGKPKLIDAVDVQGDRLAFFFEQQPILNISPETDAFLIANHHFNAGESFMNLTLVGVVENRLKIVLGDIPTLKAEFPCGLNYERSASLTIVPNSGKNYRHITVDLKYVRNTDGEECERKVRGYTKYTRYRYAWNAKRGEYVRLRGKK
jgi:hypothetical protein